MLHCFFGEVSNYQGWGWSPIMTRYQGNPAISPGVQLPKVSQSIRFAIQVAFVGRPYSCKATECRRTKIARSSYYILITSEAQRYLGLEAGNFTRQILHAWAFFRRCDMAHLKALENSICRETRFSLDCEIFDLKSQHPCGTNSNETQDK